MSLSLDIDYRSDISAPSSNELARQYPFLKEVDELKNKGLLDENTNYAGVTINAQDGLTAKATDGSITRAEVQMNDDKLSFKAINGNGDMEDCIYFDKYINKYRIKNNVQIDGIQDQADAITALEAAVEGIQNASGTATADISDLKRTVAGHTSSIGTLETNVSAHTTSIETLETAKQNHEQRITANSENIATLQTDVASAKSAIGTLNTALSEAQGNIDNLLASDEQTATTVGGMQTDISSLQGRVTTFEGAVTAINTAIEGILSRLTALEGGGSADTDPDS